ncbi:MAG: pyridoxal-dependent decarboxylase [Flavobacteriaceae bacterium]|nr:pyridoxal-dependent decarboxylase [Flavobacteriaceae bacterium]
MEQAITLNHKTKLKSLIQKTSDLLLNFIEESYSGSENVLQNQSINDLIQKLDAPRYLTEGFGSEQEIAEFIKTYLHHSTQVLNPNYVGHQVSIPHALSCIPDMIHGVVNNPTTLYEMGQSGATLEHFVINWMLSKIGWIQNENILDFKDHENKPSGFLTHGGSLANLTVLCAARAATSPDSWKEGNAKDLVVMGPESVHYSISRALSIIGLGSDAYIAIPTDDNEVIKSEEIASIYHRVVENGQKVMLMVANACATSTGYYDPIQSVGEFCSKHDIWFHVDGAHGASALLTDKYRHHLKGIELADSVVWDAHKMMRTTTLCTAILFKKFKHQAQNLQQKGSYLFHKKESLGKDSLPYTLECTKAPLGTKVYWALAIEGEKAMGQYVEQCYDKGHEFYNLIEQSKDFEGFHPPQSNIINYRYRPDLFNNKQQLEIRNQVIASGKTYITSTEIKGVRYLRSTICNPLTEKQHFLFVLDQIRSAAKDLFDINSKWS